MKKIGCIMMMGTLALGLNGWSAASSTDADFPPLPSNKVKKQKHIEEFPLSLPQARQNLKEMNEILAGLTNELKPYENVVNSIDEEKKCYGLLLGALKEQSDNPSEELKVACAASKQRLQDLLKKHKENQKNPLYGHLILESIRATTAKGFYEDYIRSMTQNNL